MAQQSHSTTLHSNPKKEFEPSKAEGSLLPTNYEDYPRLKPPFPASNPEPEDEVETEDDEVDSEDKAATPRPTE